MRNGSKELVEQEVNSPARCQFLHSVIDSSLAAQFSGCLDSNVRQGLDI